eukprot:3433043-Amphidinium_carterae.1
MEHLYEHAWRTTVSKGSFYKALEEMNGRMTQLGDTPLRCLIWHNLPPTPKYSPTQKYLSNERSRSVEK